MQRVDHGRMERPLFLSDQNREWPRSSRDLRHSGMPVRPGGRRTRARWGDGRQCQRRQARGQMRSICALTSVAMTYANPRRKTARKSRRKPLDKVFERRTSGNFRAFFRHLFGPLSRAAQAQRGRCLTATVGEKIIMALETNGTLREPGPVSRREGRACRWVCRNDRGAHTRLFLRIKTKMRNFAWSTSTQCAVERAERAPLLSRQEGRLC